MRASRRVELLQHQNQNHSVSSCYVQSQQPSMWMKITNFGHLMIVNENKRRLIINTSWSLSPVLRYGIRTFDWLRSYFHRPQSTVRVRQSIDYSFVCKNNALYNATVCSIHCERLYIIPQQYIIVNSLFWRSYLLSAARQRYRALFPFLCLACSPYLLSLKTAPLTLQQSSNGRTA